MILLVLAQLVAGYEALNMNRFFAMKARGADELLRHAGLGGREKPACLATRLRQCADSAKSSPNALDERHQGSEMRIGPVPASAGTAGRASGMAAGLAGMRRARGAAAVSSPDYRSSTRTLNPAINDPGAPWCR